MSRKYVFALGNIWSWKTTKSLNPLIKYAKNMSEHLNVEGIELTFRTKEELYSTRLTEENILWLQNLNYVSIHAPFGLTKESQNEKEVEKQLNKIQRMYQIIDASMIVIYANQLPSKKQIKNMNVSVDNLPKRRRGKKGLDELLSERPDVGFCLDVSHAYRISKYETSRLVNKYRNRITQVHISGAYRGKDHLSIKQATGEFIRSLEPILSLDVPIIIEENHAKQGIETGNFRAVAKEIKRIKKILGD